MHTHTCVAYVAGTGDTPLATLAPTATTYKDTKVSDNTVYTYTVYTTSEGEYSDPVTVTFKDTGKPPTLSQSAKTALKTQATSRGGGGGGGGSRTPKTVTSTTKATTPSSGNNTGRRTTTATPLRSLPLFSAGTLTTLPQGHHPHHPQGPRTTQERLVVPSAYTEWHHWMGELGHPGQRRTLVHLNRNPHHTPHPAYRTARLRHH